MYDVCLAVYDVPLRRKVGMKSRRECRKWTQEGKNPENFSKNKHRASNLAGSTDQPRRVDTLFSLKRFFRGGDNIQSLSMICLLIGRFGPSHQVTCCN